jgi:uncharacterized membrane protein YeaQ/YmgE (transglycosylase-associated protein family)
LTGQGLITAVVVGVVIGVAGRALACRGRGVPLWLPPAAGVAGAVLATVVLWMADTDRTGPTLLEAGLQVFFAIVAVTIVAVTADPPGVRAR